MRPKNPSKTAQAFYDAEDSLPMQKRDGEVRLAEEHGNDWHIVKAAAEMGFRSLNPKQQEALRLGFGEGGVHALNDPAVITRLANKASGAIPNSAREIEMEINLLRHSLRQDRNGWLQNPAKRYRLMRLLRAQKEVPTAVAKLNQPVTSKTL